MSDRRWAALGLAIPLLLGAGIGVSPRPPRTDYGLLVLNGMGHPMDLSYSDADTTTEHVLGMVEGFASAEFTIVSPAATTIYVNVRAEAMPGYLRRVRVALHPDGAVAIRL